MKRNDFKTILFASLIAAMILPISSMVLADLEADNSNEKPTKEFTGQLKSETRKVGSYLIVKHSFTSDALASHNVDHIYREEIVPISEQMTEEQINEYLSTPQITPSKKLDVIHEKDSAKLSAFQKSENKGIPTAAFQQWNVVGYDEDTTPTSVMYESSTTFTSNTENWASKSDSNAYVEYDPINLVWSDTVTNNSPLLQNVQNTMESRGWDDWCIYSNDLYVLINGQWTRQDQHIIDNTGGTCNQYHIRVWAINNDEVIGSAHKEQLAYKLPWERLDYQHISSTGPNYWERYASTEYGFYHSLQGFDNAEDRASSVFYGSCWNVDQDSQWLNNAYTRNTYKNQQLENSATNDGYATVITCS